MSEFKLVELRLIYKSNGKFAAEFDEKGNVIKAINDELKRPSHPVHVREIQRINKATLTSGYYYKIMPKAQQDKYQKELEEKRAEIAARKEAEKLAATNNILDLIVKGTNASK